LLAPCAEKSKRYFYKGTDLKRKDEGEIDKNKAGRIKKLMEKSLILENLMSHSLKN